MGFDPSPSRKRSELGAGNWPVFIGQNPKRRLWFPHPNPEKEIKVYRRRVSKARINDTKIIPKLTMNGWCDPSTYGFLSLLLMLYSNYVPIFDGWIIHSTSPAWSDFFPPNFPHIWGDRARGVTATRNSCCTGAEAHLHLEFGHRSVDPRRKPPGSWECPHDWAISSAYPTHPTGRVVSNPFPLVLNLPPTPPNNKHLRFSNRRD